MATLNSPTLSPVRRPPRGFIRRCEGCCWAVFTRMPLVIVYSLTTWAVYVEADLSLTWASTSGIGYILLLLGVALYLLLNWSYTTCAFTDPGSPLNHSPSSSSRHDYSHLPTYEPSNNHNLPSFTVKSTGDTRFCKKCQAKKPDRTHHCSTCRRCVLKMDHHCPWLATCVGLRNYKAFVLFCTYTTIFCYTCFGVSSSFVWSELASATFERNGGLLGVNMVLLAVLSGIIGLVLTGFTAWHLSLAYRNLTTIECLEKTRYVSPIRKTMARAAQAVGRPSGEESVGLMQKYGQQLTEMHANTIPGVTRPEEGEERTSPSANGERQMTAVEALRMNYNEMEREREKIRYENYLDEKDSEKLPNAFDLGWQRNLGMVFGKNKLLWFLPICNSVGDGWHWEPSPKWMAAREAVKRERELQWREQESREQSAGWSNGNSNNSYYQPTTLDDEGDERHYLTTSDGVTPAPKPGCRYTSKANQVLGRSSSQYADEGSNAGGRPGSEMSLKTLRRPGHRADEDSSSLDGLYDNESPYAASDDEGQGGDSWSGQGGGSRSASRRRDKSQDDWRSWD